MPVADPGPTRSGIKRIRAAVGTYLYWPVTGCVLFKCRALSLAMVNEPQKRRPEAFHDKRRFARQRVSRAVSIVTLTRPQLAADVRDLTPSGCGLVTDHRIAIGSFVDVVFDQRIRTAGWVTWSRDGALGVDFDYPLVPAAFEHILLESSILAKR